jgi:asparagine synthase (glutamine-hydrolysing)
MESDAAYERRFRELLEQAVESRLRTNATVGADLSGGLDSTAVTVVGRDLLPDETPLYTFSDVYDDAPSSDEREFIELITERDGISSEYIFLDDVGILVDIEDVLQYFDHPPHNTTHFGKWMRAKRIDEVGARVHLKGEMGDEAVSHGLGYLPELFMRGRWIRLNRELEALGNVIGASRKHLLANNTIRPLIPSSATRTVRRIRDEPILAKRSNPTLDPEFIQKHDLQARFKSMRADISIFNRTANYSQYVDLMSGRTTATFETIDLIDAAFGIEPRYPFTDVRLVEFLLAIPPSQQLADGYTRSILRRSLGDLLPEKIQWRPWKAMPGEAVNNALQNNEEQLERLVENPEHVTKYLDEVKLEDAYNRYLNDGSDRRSLIKALSLSAWLQKYGPDSDGG